MCVNAVGESVGIVARLHVSRVVGQLGDIVKIFVCFPDVENVEILEPAHGGTTGYRPTWNDADGIAADIYAIGKIIYCLYSGMDASDFPVLPSGLKLRKVAALNRIALKCCSESPERRYKNVAQIRCDIENLRNRPTWRSRLRITNAVSTPLLILLLLALAFFHFKPKAEARMRRIPEKTALSRECV